jgi:putative ABC transport system permease protein
LPSVRSAAPTTCRCPGLFRDQVDPERRWPRRRYLVALALAVAALVGLAVLAAYDQRIALIFIGAAAAAFRAPALRRDGHHGAGPPPARAPRRAAPRLALANLHRPERSRPRSCCRWAWASRSS